MKGPVYHKKALTEFFRGVSKDTIRKILREYYIPRCGPDEKFYAQSDLEAFVADPEAYRVVGRRQGRTDRIDAVDIRRGT